MLNILSDVRFALRLLARSPGFAAASVLTIALGIGPNTAIFSLLYAVFWAPSGNPNAGRQSVVWFRHGDEQGSGVRGGIHVSPRDYLDWKRESASFERLDAVLQRNVTLNDDADYPERLQIQSYTPGTVTGYYSMRFAVGRDFEEEEGRPGKGEVVILSNRFWQQRYKSNPNVLGKQIRLDGRPHTIVGVLERGWWDRRREPMWPCLVVSADQPNRDQHTLTVLGLRKPGISNPQAEAELNRIAARSAERYPKTNAGWTVRVDQAKNSWLNERTSSNLRMF
jgi:putative ABC transport system permease protein